MDGVPLQIQFSEDRKSATVSGADNLETHDVLVALVAANVVDLFRQTSTKSGMRRFYNVVAGSGETGGMSEQAAFERAKALRLKFKSEEQLWPFVEMELAQRATGIDIPEGLSFEQVVAQHEAAELTAQIARGEAPEPETFERMQEPGDLQPFARGMAFDIVIGRVFGNSGL